MAEFYGSRAPPNETTDSSAPGGIGAALLSAKLEDCSGEGVWSAGLLSFHASAERAARPEMKAGYSQNPRALVFTQ